MTAMIIFKLLTWSQLLTRLLALHTLRKAEGALPAIDNFPAVRVLGLIDVRIDLDGSPLEYVRSELEASRVLFSLDTDFPNHLVGHIGTTPWLRIWAGHKSTLHLMIEIAEGMEVRSQ
jgi:hypothetical protein